MKVAVSIPNRVFDEAEQLARRLGKSRSELYADAIADYLEEHRAETITEQLNAVYASEPAEIDPVLTTLQEATLDPEGW